MRSEEIGPVVVGIDGSDAAIETAQWAAAEALARDVPLRLISVANVPRTLMDWELTGPEAENARAALRAASAAVAATDDRVKIETELLWGPPSNALIAESRQAAMVCVGTVGIGWIARAVLGSTAAAVAEHAHCPVAVIHPNAGGRAGVENWVAVGIDGRPGTDVAVKMAVEEAQLRHAPLIAVGLGCNGFGVNNVGETERRVEQCRSRHPDVRIDVAETRGSLADFLVSSRRDLTRRYSTPADLERPMPIHPLAVVGSADAGELARIVGPHDHAVRDHPRCSVLISR